MAMTPMIASVSAAFFACGRRNAGTPFEIASTPVSAVAPEENALRTAKTPIAVGVVAAFAIGSTGRRGRAAADALVHADRDRRQDRGDEPVRGDREHLPDSRVAAEVRIVTSQTNPIDSEHLWSLAAGNADPIAKTPATIVTTTVIM